MDRPEDWPYPDFEPAATADERTTLTSFLDHHRTYFEAKCAGLDVEQMARRSAEPSALSLLGLLRHLSEVERNWFRNVMGGGSVPRYFATESDHDADINDAGPSASQVEQAWSTWHAEVEFARRFVDSACDLDVTGTEKWRGPLSLRWVLVHMIEEYAQHNGHADLLRERIDGVVTIDPMDDVTPA